jgi:hypothetical protein
MFFFEISNLSGGQLFPAFPFVKIPWLRFLEQTIFLRVSDSIIFDIKTDFDTTFYSILWSNDNLQKRFCGEGSKDTSHLDQRTIGLWCLFSSNESILVVRQLM